MGNLDAKLRNNLIYGILIAFLINIAIGVAILILNELKLKNAVKNNNMKEIETTQKIINILITVATVLFIISIAANLIAYSMK